ncbi:helix-turn-helix domain-containing protein [Streptomyces sp. MS19]|uniref:helix-turn-helix domain-containing protein n=1 Tax=Streptomyces sp. MS19 TaxID=3385972 RepID=UPI0039A168A7
MSLGRRLRELRRAAGLNGRQLAESLSWPPSKVSKLENGRQTPTDDDIRRWSDATGSPQAAEALLAVLHTREVRHAEWRDVLRAGLHPHQQKLASWEARTRLFRVFEATVIPGLLQTPDYARARFTEAARRLAAPSGIDAAVAGRMRRQDILYRADKRFHVLLTEAALRFRLCAPHAMLGQLDRLMSLSQLPNVRLGVIAFETAYTVAPWHGFWLYDDARVVVETLSAELDLRQPQEIELYGAAFQQLAQVASYGRAARTVINRVIEDLAPHAADDGA